MADATTGALAIVAANAAAGAWASSRHGAVAGRLALGFGAAGVAGALAGSALQRLVSGEAVLFLLALVMLAAARALWRGRPGRVPPPPGGRAGRVALVGGLGVGVGVLTGFFGVGGGFLIVPTLVLVLGLPMREAVGTSLLIIALTATGGLAGHLGAGGLSVPLVVAFAAAGVAGSLSGVALGRRVPTRSLSRAFALTLVGVAVALMAANAPALWP